MDVIKFGQGIKAEINAYANLYQLEKIEDDDGKKDRIEIVSIKDEYSPIEIKKAVEKLNKFLEVDNTHVEYEVHDKFGDLMIRIVDDKTKEVIVELPPKKVLDLVAKLCEMAGVVLDKKA